MINMVRSLCCQVSTKLMQETYWSNFFWKYETQEKIALGRQYFLRAERRRVFWYWRGGRFEEACCGKETTQGWRDRKQVDENQMAKLWIIGAVDLQMPHQLPHRKWWNNRYERPTRTPQLQIQDFKDRENYYTYTEHSTNPRTGETDDPKARRKYNNKIFLGNSDQRDPYLALKSTSATDQRESTDFICSQSTARKKTSGTRSFPWRGTAWQT